MARSRIWDFIDGYEELHNENGVSVTGKRFLCKSYSGAVTGQMRRRSQRGLFRLWRDIVKRVSYMSSKAYGGMSLSFGLVTIILSFLEDYGSATGEATAISFIIGVGFALLSIPLLLFDEPLSLLLQNFGLTDRIFFEFLCINRVARAEKPKSVSTVFASLFGVALALVGYFVPAWWVVSVFFGFVFLCLALSSPEFSLFATLLILPYLSLMEQGELVLSAMILVTLISFAKKVLSGKRVLNLEQYDLFLLLTMMTVMISGAFVKGASSIVEAFLMLAASLGYLLMSNLVTNRRLADCSLNAVVISSVPVCAVSFYKLIFAAVSSDIVETLKNGISSTFDSADGCAVFLTVSAVFSAALIKQSGGAQRVLYVLALIINLAALLLTGEAFAAVALLLGVLVYFAIKFKGWSALVTAVLFTVPYILVLVPFSESGAWLTYMSGSADLSSLAEVWRSALGVFSDNVSLGIGIGEESFREAMSGFDISADNASNLFIELALEAGVFAFIFFFAMLLVRLRHRAMYYVYVKSSQVSVSAPMLAVALFALLCFGAVNYIWSDMPSCFLFWCVFGFGSATLRVAKREYDDRVLYYEDTRSSDASVVDVEIN